MAALPRLVHGTPAPEAPKVPVAIVGAGACGLVTAIALRDAGVACVLLERDAQPAGSTALSSGFIPAPGTAAQRAAGVHDSPALLARDIQAKAHGTAAPHLVQAYATQIGPALDTLQARHGIEFTVLDGFLYPGHSVRRMHAVPEKTGAALVAQLERAAMAAGADLLTEATVRELWVDDRQRVTGVGFERPDGRVEHLRCDALVLACNGFGGNAAMVRELLPEMREALFAGHTGNDGSAMAWGRALGARLADLGGYQGHGSWAVPQGALISWALMMEGGVQLNAHGERFHDESQGYSEAAVNVLAQPGGVAWNVFDGPILELARSFPDFCHAEAAGALRRCEDVAALAALIGCDVSKIIAMFDQMTGAEAPKTLKNATNRLFGRALRAPYYAVKVTGALFHTQGGLDIDANCRVLREDGTPLPNLMAAGGAARGVSGNAVWGYLSGNGLLSAVAGGAIAAATAARQVNP
ncbi:MAG: FAD-dependent oxidoreductase [Burkholderiaceae bacterium]|nr:FAD-dependent oxidoreductase [Burkholderiaceae bacterium]MDZ4144087.1 FAD-dependent oxidoreductase [Burkholderiales bacterium]